MESTREKKDIGFFYSKNVGTRCDIKKMHYKECSPIETVKKIKGILDFYGIETDELIRPDESIGTYTIRLTLKGTNIGQNGKGVDEDYCRASAYAEFIERLQNLILYSDAGFYNDKKNFAADPNEKIMTAEEIVDGDTGFIKFILKGLKLDDKKREEKVELFKEYIQIESITTGKENQFVTIPFMNFKTKRIEYLPSSLLLTSCGSNGMSAGNTMYEAIVQAMAEIVERIVQLRVIVENICLPDIPDDYIMKFPYIFEMYEKARKDSRFTVKLKDASLGGKYPVAALLIIEKNTGKYGVKYGCHPDYGIAMERAFTEVTQGRKIEDYARLGFIDFNNSLSHMDSNILTSFQIGQVQMPYQFFGNIPDYKFSEMKDVKSSTNKEMAKEWIDDFVNQGFDVLIRDASIMGFPSLMIVIPGVSNLINLNEDRCRILNTKAYLVKKLNKLDNFTREDCKYLVANIVKSENFLDENKIDKFFKCISREDMPGEDLFLGGTYLAAVGSMVCEEYDKANYFMKKICSAAMSCNINSEKKDFYNCLRDYTNAMNSLKNHNQSMEYIRAFYSKHLCIRIEEKFADTEKIIINQYKEITERKDEKLLYWSNKICDVIQEAGLSADIDQNKLMDLFN